MTSHCGLLLTMAWLGSIWGGCQKEETSPAPSEPKVVEGGANRAEARRASEGSVRLRIAVGNSKNGAESEPVVPPARVWGWADRDPGNDNVVAPPEAVPDCHAKLEAAGVKFLPAALPLKQIVGEIPTCGCHDAVTVTHAPLGMKIAPPAVVSCQMALALVRLEGAIQELAQKHLTQGVRTLHHGGTYSCRKMVRFDLVSEHSYGNAIDVFAFTLESGEKVSVLSDFGALMEAPTPLSPRAKFLRELSSAAYDREIMSVSLSPYWDALHRDHFHFDMARYRVDGSRPR